MPSIYQLAVQLRAMYDGRTPVKAAALAKSCELAEVAIAQVLCCAASSNLNWCATFPDKAGFRCKRNRRQLSFHPFNEAPPHVARPLGSSRLAASPLRTRNREYHVSEGQPGGSEDGMFTRADQNRVIDCPVPVAP